jgi:hypothetical protein
LQIICVDVPDTCALPEEAHSSYLEKQIQHLQGHGSDDKQHTDIPVFHIALWRTALHEAFVETKEEKEKLLEDACMHARLDP